MAHQKKAPHGQWICFCRCTRRLCRLDRERARSCMAGKVL
ncbi:hypothetical protein PCL1606_54500 [Pseudomonas chlororaphis]|uniref:Uncharacterized protein n=1 Tax=Pseudomonas chlororaphis TaxID=587753 RepID=A0A0D5Y797_9PSED|nr:hypothetical protein PCL1606_54500 [Pseudomonas chlororaphis]